MTQIRASGAAIPAPTLAAHRLRRDLVFAPRDPRGRVVLKDLRNQKMYAFSALTCAALQLFDGTVQADELPERLRRTHGVDISGQSVAALVDRARSLGLFEDDAAAAPPSANVAATLARFNPFYIRLNVVNPRAVLRWAETLLFPLFSASGVACFVAALGAAVALLTLAWQRYGNSFVIFGFFQHWIAAWVILTLSGVLHELGHAAACERYGGRVIEAGFLLYLFQPAFYTNVNDAWLLPRRQRVVVSLGGIYVEAWLWCACVALWYVSPPFSAPNQLLFIVTVVLSSRIAINLFPFLRLDGYFILADLLSIPNLRPKALVLIASLVPMVGRPLRAPRPLQRAEAAILAAYGVLSLGSVGYLLRRSFLASRARWGAHPSYWIVVGAVALMAVATIYQYLARHKSVLAAAGVRG